MKRLILFLLFSTIVLTACSTKKKPPETRFNHYFHELSAFIKLEEPQRLEVLKIEKLKFEDLNFVRMKYRDKGKAGIFDMTEEIYQIRKKSYKKLTPILSEWQMKQYKIFEKNNEEKFRNEKAPSGPRCPGRPGGDGIGKPPKM